MSEEPTTGLDASCALMLGQVLAKLAEEPGAGEPGSCTCAAHHTSQIFEKFDESLNHMISPGFNKVPQDLGSAHLASSCPWFRTAGWAASNLQHASASSRANAFVRCQADEWVDMFCLPDSARCQFRSMLQVGPSCSKWILRSH